MSEKFGRLRLVGAGAGSARWLALSLQHGSGRLEARRPGDLGPITEATKPLRSFQNLPQGFPLACSCKPRFVRSTASDVREVLAPIVCTAFDPSAALSVLKLNILYLASWNTNPESSRPIWAPAHHPQSEESLHCPEPLRQDCAPPPSTSPHGPVTNGTDPSDGRLCLMSSSLDCPPAGWTERVFRRALSNPTNPHGDTAWNREFIVHCRQRQWPSVEIA